MKKKSKKRRGLGAVQTRDIVILGLGIAVVWALTRKPIQTESKVVFDTSGILRDIQTFRGK